MTLRCALKLALRRGLWSGNVAALLPSRFAPEYKPRDRFLSLAQMQALLARITADHAARLAFQIATSANLGETNRAERSDVGDGFVHVRGTKRTSRLRDVPIVTSWQVELLTYAEAHAHGEDGRLFRFGQSYANALRRTCAAVGVAHVSSNDLRRTFAHWMLVEGVSRPLVAAAMGHSSTAMLDRVYGRLTRDELAGMMARELGRAPPVPQTHAHPSDTSHAADAPHARKSPIRKGVVVGREGFEPSTNGLKAGPSAVRPMSPGTDPQRSRGLGRPAQSAPHRGSPVHVGSGGPNEVQASRVLAAPLRALAGGAARLTVRDVAARLGVSMATVYAICERGELAHVRVSNAIRIEPSQLAAYVARQARPRGEPRQARRSVVASCACGVTYTRRAFGRLELLDGGDNRRCRVCAGRVELLDG